MKKDFHLTKAGIEQLKEELTALKSQRGEIANKLKIARSFGDLSENAEYDAARTEQGQVEARIQEIQHILLNVEVIEHPRKVTSVKLGCEVILTSPEGNLDFHIVGSVEADPLQNRVSDESPIGKAVIGKKVGEKVEIQTPNGSKTYTIKSIK